MDNIDGRVIEEPEHITDGGACWCHPDRIEVEDGVFVVVYNSIVNEVNWLQNEMLRGARG